jgi:hypothetical protein
MCSEGVVHYWRGTDGKSRWARAAFGGDEAEAKERGRKTDL